MVLQRMDNLAKICTTQIFFCKPFKSVFFKISSSTWSTWTLWKNAALMLLTRQLNLSMYLYEEHLKYIWKIITAEKLASWKETLCGTNIYTWHMYIVDKTQDVKVSSLMPLSIVFLWVNNCLKCSSCHTIMK